MSGIKAPCRLVSKRLTCWSCDSFVNENIFSLSASLKLLRLSLSAGCQWNLWDEILAGNRWVKYISSTSEGYRFSFVFSLTAPLQPPLPHCAQSSLNALYLLHLHPPPCPTPPHPTPPKDMQRLRGDQTMPFSYHWNWIRFPQHIWLWIMQQTYPLPVYKMVLK